MILVMIFLAKKKNEDKQENGSTRSACVHVVSEETFEQGHVIDWKMSSQQTQN